MVYMCVAAQCSSSVFQLLCIREEDIRGKVCGYIIYKESLVFFFFFCMVGVL